jgi:hypothetical protein
MKRNHRFTLLTSALLLALMFSSMQTVIVRADDSPPPTPETEESVQPPVEESIVVQEPAATETPVATEETASLPEVLEQLPEETNIVVLDASGDPLPLVSEAAVEILAAPDPYFTVGGVTYNFTSVDCDPDTAGAQPCATPIQAAIDYLSSHDYVPDDDGFGNHNIYVEADSYREDVTIDGLWWSSAPASLGLIGVAGSGSTFLDGLMQISNMNAFTLSGFTIEDIDESGNTTTFLALSNTGTLQLSDVNVTNSAEIALGIGMPGIIVLAQDGDISLSNVTADNNISLGAILDNSAGEGNITIMSSQFNNNAEGIFVFSNGNISLSDVTASGNVFGGAFLDNSLDTGTITVTNSQFNDNGWGEDAEAGDGLVALSGGDIRLLKVTANNNYYAGAYLDNGCGCNTGNIFVTASEFTGNGLESGWDGLDVFSAGDIDVQCSYFANNGEYGIYSEMDGGTLSLHGNTFAGNLLGDLFLDGGVLVETSNCQSSTNRGKKTTGEGLPLNVIHVNGGEQNILTCDGFSGTELILPNGDRVILPCPNGDQASIDTLSSAQLPGALDGNFTFISGLDANVTPALLGSMTVKFTIPADQTDADFTILHWDGTQWEDLGGDNASGFFRVDTGSAGVFVLVSR